MESPKLGNEPIWASSNECGTFVSHEQRGKRRRGSIDKKKFCQYLRQPSGSSWTPQCGCTLESWARVICGACLARYCPPLHHHFLDYLCDSFLLLHCCHCHRVSVCWRPPHRHLGGSVASFWTWPARRSAHLQSHTSNYQRLCTRKLLWYNPRNLWRCTVLFITCERSML